MMNGYDVAYRALLGVTWPLWASRRRLREKVADAFATRDGSAPRRAGNGPAVLVHAVSVGELNAARALIDALCAARPELYVIVTTTTTVGDDLARRLFGARPATTVLRFPIDLAANIDRLLDATRPTLVVLMELEVWPNFLAQCARRQIPVVVANGRVTRPSFQKYRLLGPLAWAMFRRLAWCVAQDETYADRFRALGVPEERLRIAGTMKFDSATVGDTVPGAAELAHDLFLPLPLGEGWGEGQRPPVWVVGSTGPGEEAIVLDVYARLLQTHDELRLAIVPRKPDRFDEVAALIDSRGHACVRRSRSSGPHPNPLPEGEGTGDAPPDSLGTRHSALGTSPPVVLGDTMGELRKFYALATVVFVGRTLVDLGPKQHGSDMIEPCALGRPAAVGPFTGNFEEPMRALRAAGAIAEVADADALFAALDAWLRDPAAARELGARARRVVVSGKGAVARHVELMLPLL